MKFAQLINKFKKKTRKSISQYKEEVLIRQGREQFQQLMKKGLGIPVALL